MERLNESECKVAMLTTLMLANCLASPNGRLEVPFHSCLFLLQNWVYRWTRGTYSFCNDCRWSEECLDLPITTFGSRGCHHIQTAYELDLPHLRASKPSLQTIHKNLLTQPDYELSSVIGKGNQVHHHSMYDILELAIFCRASRTFQID